MRRQKRPLTAVLALTLLISTALAACSGDEAPSPTSTPQILSPSATRAPSATFTPIATPTLAAPTATATPDLRDGGVSIVETAYNRLLNEYLSPLSPADVLVPAWQGLAAALAKQGFASPRQPSFAGSREEAWTAFHDMYVAAISANPGIDETTARYAVLTRITSSLSDCHTFFLPPVQAQELDEIQTGKGTVSIGVALAWGPPVIVREAYTGGPAARAGMRPGDRFVTIDGEDASALDLPSIDERLRGDDGSHVSVTFVHASGGDPVSVELTRELVDPPTVESRLLEDGIGYVRIRAFIQGGVSGEIDKAIASLTAAGATRFVFDIRDNPGGYLDVPSISRFVASGVIVLSEGRADSETSAQADGSYRPPPLPIALLVNEGTASVAEIFAAALKDYSAAHIIGTATSGCGGYTSIQPLGDGSTLGVTIARNLTPLSKQSLEHGLSPDERVERKLPDVAAGRDPVLERAIAYLLGR